MRPLPLLSRVSLGSLASLVSLVSLVLASTAVAALGAGCSSSTNAAATPAPATGDVDASNDGGPSADAAPVACSDPTATSDQPCGTLSWAASSTLSRKRNHHVTFVAKTGQGPFLYVIGGGDGAQTWANVDRAPLGADGSVGAFVDQAVTPKPVAGLTGGVVTIGTSNVIVIAGGTNLRVTDQAFSAAVGDDGTLAPWKSAGSVLQNRMHPGAFVAGDTIYVLGGFNDPSVWDDVVRAKVSADGTVSAWTAAGKLPGPRSHMSVSFADGYVYLTGGLAKSAFGNPPVLRDVSRGHLLEDGTVGEWTAMPAFPTSIATHSSFVYGGYLYAGGGIDDTTQLKAVWRAPIGADHALGAWEAAADLPVARGHVHQLPVFGNHVYSVAGAIDFDLSSTDQIAVGSFL
jgi:hypothetical protein